MEKCTEWINTISATSTGIVWLVCRDIVMFNVHIVCLGAIHNCQHFHFNMVIPTVRMGDRVQK